MKPFACKCLFLLPIILFLDYMILVVFGVASFQLGAGENIYSTTYLPVGLMLIGASLVFFVGILTRHNKKEICDQKELL